MRSVIMLFSAGFLLVLTSCERKKLPLMEPIPLMIRPISNDQVMPGTVLDGMQLYYFQQNIKKNVPDFGRAPGSGYQDGILHTKDIVSLSANDHVKEYFLEFPDGDIDTLFVDYQVISEKEGREDPCICLKPLRNFRINGVTPPIVDTLKPGGMDVYQLNK